jgi:hypothetical protein
VTWNMNGKVKFPTPEKKWLCCSLSLSLSLSLTHTHTHTHTHCLLIFVINMLVDNSPWSIRIALGGLWRLGGAGWEQLQVWSTGGRFARGASEKHRTVIGNSTCGYSCVSQPPSFSFFSAKSSLILFSWASLASRSRKPYTVDRVDQDHKIDMKCSLEW